MSARANAPSVPRLLHACKATPATSLTKESRAVRHGYESRAPACAFRSKESVWPPTPDEDPRRSELNRQMRRIVDAALQDTAFWTSPVTSICTVLWSLAAFRQQIGIAVVGTLFNISRKRFVRGAFSPASAGPSSARGRQFAPNRNGAYSSSVAVTGTWSDGRSHPRVSLSTSSLLTRSASAGATQMWSSRRPLSAVFQSGER